ncbi:phage terminase small subunit [Cupriavidus alkaliphilus]|uniref:terminase small subunit n=1 Tax=Cupriavidus alkaliphilus TaxID=942866 RepID=UPI000DE73072|nr:terminase small subunit [Cupriavidus alkaliphilus]PVY81067.1 phage terminase small subunit [Cupriavidus alkaliphilus]
MALTGKKLKFAEAKAQGLSNKQAAIDAGYSAGTAASAGSRLAKDPDVLAHLARKSKAGAARKAAPPAKAAPKAQPAREPESLDDDAAAAAAAFNWEQATHYSDPKAFLKAVMNDDLTEPKLRVFAAKELMPYFHRKLGDTGKKEDRADAAKKAASGRFAAAAPPLRAVK